MSVCRKCGIMRAMFATGFKPGPDGEAFVDTGLCVSCRHGKRPGAQWSGGLMELKALLHEMNRRPRKKGRR